MSSNFSASDGKASALLPTPRLRRRGTGMVATGTKEFCVKQNEIPVMSPLQRGESIVYLAIERVAIQLVYTKAGAI